MLNLIVLFPPQSTVQSILTKIRKIKLSTMNQTGQDDLVKILPEK